MSSETTALATREISLSTWHTIQAIAPDAKASGLFGVGNQAAAMMIMLKGYELGLGLTASFEYIHVIESRPSLSPRGALALVVQSPLCAGIEIKPLENPIGCEVVAKRTNGLTFTARFTLDDAETAGLVKDGSGWKKYPRQMCQWRAVGYALDVVFPDVIGGLKRADELGAEITPQGEVIEGTWTTAPASQPEPPAPAKPDAATRLRELADKYGADAVFAANGNRMPADLDEVEALAAKMEAAGEQA